MERSTLVDQVNNLVTALVMVFIISVMVVLFVGPIHGDPVIDLSGIFGGKTTTHVVKKDVPKEKK